MKFVKVRANFIPYYAVVTALMLSLWLSTSGHWLSFVPESTSIQPLITLHQNHSAAGDADEYLKMAAGDGSYAPYRYRVLIPGIVGALDVPPMAGFLFVNLICFVATGVIFTAYLRRDFNATAALLGGVLAVTTFGMQNTVLFAYIEPGSYLAFAALLWAARSRRVALFVTVAIVAVLTKEVLAFLAAGLWMMEVYANFRQTRADRSAAADRVHGD